MKPFASRWLNASLAFLLALGLVLGDSLVTERLATALVPLPIATAATAIVQMENTWEAEYESYFGREFAGLGMTPTEIATTLGAIEARTGQKAAVLWVMSTPDKLNLALTTEQAYAYSVNLPAANAARLNREVRQLRRAINAPQRTNSESYLEPATQLYDWLIRPVRAQLTAAGIETLLICPGASLRSLPFAALYDAQTEQYLIEQYSFSVIPAFNLTNIQYRNLQTAQVLAMGASQFANQPALPGVEAELQFIPLDRWQNKAFLNQEFTPETLKAAHQDCACEIVHLATHAEFRPGLPGDSYIQFYDRPLFLDQINTINWDDPPVDLLVLSACETAIGDQQAELGFAGLAIQSGVRSVLASLWYVSDTGTMGLMSEFYRAIATAPIKAAALRQAQIALLRGQVFIQDGQLHTSSAILPLPNGGEQFADATFTHPYHWATYTLIGSPW